jgi:hypothetical protein
MPRRYGGREGGGIYRPVGRSIPNGIFSSDVEKSSCREIRASAIGVEASPETSTTWFGKVPFATGRLTVG